VEAHDLYERLRPVLEEYFDNWLIVGHRAGDKKRIALGHAKPKWNDMQAIRDEIKRWQKKPLENPRKIPSSTGKTPGKKSDSDETCQGGK
jgi:hypothetical protein